jgi:hypothetical protein
MSYGVAIYNHGQNPFLSAYNATIGYRGYLESFIEQNTDNAK